MKCNMPSKGDRIDLIVATGNSTLRELLEKAFSAAKKADIAKLEALIEAMEANLIYLHVVKGEITTLCLERAGEKHAGNRALQILRNILGEKPLVGYIEVLRISKAAFEIDLESEPDASLNPPISVEKLVETAPRSVPAPVERAASSEGPEEAAAKSVIDRIDVGEVELASILLYILDKSSFVRASRNPQDVIIEAKEKSANDSDFFYRVAIEFDSGDVCNIFYYKGSACSMIHLLPEGFRARFVEKISESDIQRLASSSKPRITRAVLYKVACRDCAKAVLKGCIDVESTAQKEENKGGEAESATRSVENSKPKRKLGFLSLFRRRKG